MHSDFSTLKNKTLLSLLFILISLQLSVNHNIFTISTVFVLLECQLVRIQQYVIFFFRLVSFKEQYLNISASFHGYIIRSTFSTELAVRATVECLSCSHILALTVNLLYSLLWQHLDHIFSICLKEKNLCPI